MKNQFLKSADKIVLTALVTLSLSASSFANNPQLDKIGKRKMDKMEKNKMSKMKADSTKKARMEKSEMAKDKMSKSKM